jgi:hypothetical protein
MGLLCGSIGQDLVWSGFVIMSLCDLRSTTRRGGYAARRGVMAIGKARKGGWMVVVRAMSDVDMNGRLDIHRSQLIDIHRHTTHAKSRASPCSLAPCSRSGSVSAFGDCLLSYWHVRLQL